LLCSTTADSGAPNRLELLAEDVLISALKLSQKVAIIVSEISTEPVFVPGAAVNKSKYGVVLDPLDGSTNIECNLSVGSIFGIYAIKDVSNPNLEDVLQPGSTFIAAGYVLYGSATVMMLSTGSGVHSFTLDPNYGEFILANSNLQMPDPPARICSVNTGNAEHWDQPTKDFVHWTQKGDDRYSARYNGSMVADVHRVLLRGGIFMYPADPPRQPHGKLRLLYESFPMAYLIEQAGGMATTGTERILDLKPEDVHQTTSIYLGCVRDIEQLRTFYKQAGNA